jgi:hypothetical protein
MQKLRAAICRLYTANYQSFVKQRPSAFIFSTSQNFDKQCFLIPQRQYKTISCKVMSASGRYLKNKKPADHYRALIFLINRRLFARQYIVQTINYAIGSLQVKNQHIRSVSFIVCQRNFPISV